MFVRLCADCGLYVYTFKPLCFNSLFYTFINYVCSDTRDVLLEKDCSECCTGFTNFWGVLMLWGFLQWLCSYAEIQKKIDINECVWFKVTVHSYGHSEKRCVFLVSAAKWIVCERSGWEVKARKTGRCNLYVFGHAFWERGINWELIFTLSNLTTFRMLLQMVTPKINNFKCNFKHTAGLNEEYLIKRMSLRFFREKIKLSSF